MRKLVIFFLFTLSTSWTFAQAIIIQREQTKGNYMLWAVNKTSCPATITATADSMNMEFSEYLPGHSKRMLVDLPDSSLTNMLGLDRVLEYNLTLGDPNAVPDKRYQYDLPFPVGESHELIQGNNGVFTHNEPRSQYAFDFIMDEGSLVSAARGGVVVFVEERYNQGGDDKKLMDKGNQIAICHDDGTIAAYAHIKHNGAIVKVGDRVFAGQTIAFSGNTGYTTGPHLHFVVMIGNNSIPIHFRGLKNPLVEGRVYTHHGNFQ